MSENISQVIQHRVNYGFIRLEEDYLTICNSNSCKALLLTVLEKKTLLALQNDDDDYLPISYNDFENAMYGLYKRSSIVSSLNELVQEDLIQRQQHISSYDFAYEYRLNIEVLQKRINNLPAKSKKRAKRNRSANKVIPIAILQVQFKLFQLFAGKCAYCQTNEATTWDHILAEANGGETSPENLVPACAFCNSSKSNQDVILWIQSQGFIPCQPLIDILGNLGMELRPNNE